MADTVTVAVTVEWLQRVAAALAQMPRLSDLSYDIAREQHSTARSHAYRKEAEGIMCRAEELVQEITVLVGR